MEGVPPDRRVGCTGIVKKCFVTISRVESARAIGAERGTANRCVVADRSKGERLITDCRIVAAGNIAVQCLISDRRVADAYGVVIEGLITTCRVGVAASVVVKRLKSCRRVVVAVGVFTECFESNRRVKAGRIKGECASANGSVLSASSITKKERENRLRYCNCRFDRPSAFQNQAQCSCLRW